MKSQFSDFMDFFTWRSDIAGRRLGGGFGLPRTGLSNLSVTSMAVTGVESTLGC